MISGERVAGGPTATAQSMLGQVSSILSEILPQSSNQVQKATQGNGGQAQSSSGVLDSETISKITDAEKKITQSEKPVKGGPTAKAQSHVGEPINSDNLHDITEGEKKITGGKSLLS